MPCEATWIDLQIIILSEVSPLNEIRQRKTNIMWYQINESIHKTDSDQENKLMVTKEEKEGRKDKLGVWQMLTYTHYYT